MKISAVILSGGRATRLNGDDKGLCLFRNKPLIQHVLDVVAPQTLDIVISANRHLSSYQKFGFTVVSDGNKDFDGPLTGLSKALAHCKHNKVLVTTCDMPFIPNNLLSLFDESNGASIQIISVKQRLQLCFLMDITLKQSLDNYLQAGGNRVMQWIQSHDYHEIEYEGNSHDFNNLNTYQDFKEEADAS